MSHRLAVSLMPRLLAASAVAVSTMLPVPQAPAFDVRNFRASDVSGTELQISVDVVSSGPLVVDRATLRVTPVLRGGAIDPTPIEVRSLLGPPNATTTTVVLRKRDSAPDFVSVAMQVCVLRPDRALVCRMFPHQKNWSASGTPPSPAPQPPPPAPGVCTITGRLTGRLEGFMASDTPGPDTPVRLRRVIAHADGQQSRRAAVTNRRFTFRDLRAGTRYRLVADGWQSTPQVRTIDCRPNVTHHADFRIDGPPQH